MPQFQYDGYRSPYVGTIAQMMLRPAEIEAQRATAVANAQATAAAASGDIWGRAIGTIGQTIGAIPQQIAQQKAQAQEQQLRGLQLQDAQDAVKFRTALGKAIGDTPKVDEGGVSLYDVPTIAKALDAQGFGSHAGEVIQHLGAINQAFRGEQQAKLQTVRLGAKAIQASGNDPLLTNNFLDALEANGSYRPQQIQQYRDFINADPDTNLPKVLRALAGPAEIGTAAPGSVFYDKDTGAQLGSVPGAKKTRAELATDAADPTSPTRAQSAEALKLDRPDPVEKPATPPALGSPADYLARYAREHDLDPATLTTAQVNEALKQHTDATQKTPAAPREPKPIPGDWGKQGDEFLQTIPAEWRNTVKKIAAYDGDITRLTSMRPASQGGEPERSVVARWVMQLNPQWDEGVAPARIAARKDFTSGKKSNNIVSLNTAISHAGKLSDLVGAMQNGDTQAINRVVNYVRTQMGYSDVTNAQTAATALAGEAATTFKSSGGTDQEIAKWDHAVDIIAKSPKQSGDALKTLAGLLAGRFYSLAGEYENVMGKKDMRFLTQDAREQLGKFGVDPNKWEPAGAGTVYDWNKSPTGAAAPNVVTDPATGHKYDTSTWSAADIAQAKARGWK